MKSLWLFGLLSVTVLELALTGYAVLAFPKELPMIPAHRTVTQLNEPSVDQDAVTMSGVTDSGGLGRILIPKIAVEADIVPVGLEPDGKMTSPSKPFELGWYEFGAKPGEPGNAVLAGHFDGPDGSPAIFAQLHQIAFGDVIEYTTATGTHTYKVIKQDSYTLEEAPMEEIFGKSDRKLLRLITCDGSWSMRDETYSHRLVVTAQLVE